MTPLWFVTVTSTPDLSCVPSVGSYVTTCGIAVGLKPLLNFVAVVFAVVAVTPLVVAMRPTES